MSEKIILGTVRPGYGIASKGSNKTQDLVSNVYEDRRTVTVDQTVFRQFPFFVEAGVPGIEDMHPGTINIDISLHEFSVVSPDHEVTCEWIDGVRETFWLTAATLRFNGNEYRAYIYYPCVSEQHTARNSTVEIITKRIPGIEYGVSVELIIDTEKTPVTLL
jgi:hypothetical protein